MQRNKIDDDGWLLEPIVDYSILADFDCGDADLNEYFRQDAENHSRQLLSKTYKFILKDSDRIVAAVDLCNDSIKRQNFNADDNTSPEIPEQKHYPFYPAVKITRLGVAGEFQGLGAGSTLINFLKKLFLNDNRTGCRFMTVDAYNNPRALGFYRKNGFYLFSDKDKERHTRAMFFDLMCLKLPIKS